MYEAHICRPFAFGESCIQTTIDVAFMPRGESNRVVKTVGQVRGSL